MSSAGGNQDHGERSQRNSKGSSDSRSRLDSIEGELCNLLSKVKDLELCLQRKDCEK